MSIDNHNLITLNSEKFGQTVHVPRCELLTNVVNVIRARIMSKYTSIAQSTFKDQS